MGLGYKWAAVDMDGTSGVCIFPDGTDCEEWSFYRGECGQSHSFCNLHGGTISAPPVDGGSFTSTSGICTLANGQSCAESNYAASCVCEIGP
jgi:putative hemolysin